MNSRRSWVVYGIGVFAYLIAVMQRTTIGVAGVAATDRFHVSASVLSTLAVVQLIVYAGMQVPVGVLIDRIGSRVLMLIGTALMVVGQVAVAFAPTITIAIVGRVLVGAGDATVFTSLMRLVNSWFRGRIVPQLSQWIGNVGQLGQVLSAIPFALLLHLSGWTVAFLSAAALSVVALIGITVGISDRPVGASEGPRPASWPDSLRQLRISLTRPGTQLGFWSHFVTQSSGTVFSLLWGIPFLVFALGIEPAEASALLTVLVGAGLISGPILGILTARFPLRRSNLVLGIVALMAVAWSLVLLWPGTPPLWTVIVLIAAIGIGGPGSLIGFDFARTFNPLHSLGSANGIVNVGGFHHLIETGLVLAEELGLEGLSVNAVVAGAGVSERDVLPPFPGPGVLPGGAAPALPRCAVRRGDVRHRRNNAGQGPARRGRLRRTSTAACATAA